MKKNINDNKEAERSTPTPASQQEERQPVRNVRLRFGSSGAADADDIRRIVAKSARKSEHETRRPAPLKTKDTQSLVRPRGLRQRIAVFLRNRQRRKARRKISPTVRMVRRVALILAILLVVLAGLGYAAVTYALSLIQRPGPTTHTVRPGMTAPSVYTTRPTQYKPPEFKGIQNILLLGVDDRREVDGETYNNSDVMMIVTVDMDNKTVKLTSLQRDMAVYIPGYGIHKLTDSHGFGGADLTMQTINENLRLSLTDYVAVDINESERLIDLVGGIDLYVEEEILWYVNECIGNQNLWFPDYGESPYLTQGGMQHLDGRQAVGYARVRSYDSDYKRMGRQREVLQAVFSAFMDSSLPQKITMITEGLKCIYTTLSDSEIRKLAVNIAPSMKNEIMQKQVPDPTKYGVEFIESSDFMIRADFNGIIPGLYAFLFNDPLLPFDPPLEVPGAPNAAQGLPPGIYDQWKDPQPTRPSTTKTTTTGETTAPSETTQSTTPPTVAPPTVAPPTPTKAPTPTLSPTPLPTPTLSPTPLPTPTLSPTPLPTPTLSPTPTVTTAVPTESGTEPGD